MQHVQFTVAWNYRQKSLKVTCAIDPIEKDCFVPPGATPNQLFDFQQHVSEETIYIVTFSYSELDFEIMDVVSGRDPFLNALSQILTTPDEYERSANTQARNYVRDAKAMGNTAVDIKEFPESYMFVADMPGLKSEDIKVQVENDNVLTIGGERKREEATDHTKYLLMERRAGKFLRKFTLPSNANMEAISASCTDGVLSVTVPKIPPPEPQKPKIIEVKVG
ncbi:hypothetical protein R1flu_028398 [Riccia fluitans]|uniref:SHSP domain-containing protein n=1 Tax=Riccia fluitans TaxID=41844 RepID=A0ABD1XLM6_9MARC